MNRLTMASSWLRTDRCIMLILALVLVSLQGCASPSRHKAVPDELEEKAEIPGLTTGIRYFPRDPRHVQLFIEDFVKSAEREKAYLAAQGYLGPLPPTAFLAISGGGDNGAFGAGFLNGWTKTGTRPQFKLVTGISTGALIAPFAFLGPTYDEKLKGLYTGISFSDIAEERSVLSVIFHDAMADNTPLWNLVKKYINQDMLDAIAVEHAKGRILLVGTTNLDARRPVIWNITEIAASHHPKALELIQKLLIASAAIPGTFPPVMIDVEVEGKSFQEMHVDGGTAAQVFVYPPAMMLKDLAKEQGIQRERKLYIIRNARLDPEWAEVERRIIPIALRAISTLIQFQGVGDLYRIYAITQRDGVDYNLAFIPPTFDAPHEKDFDTAYMRKLFEVGYRMAEIGYSWYKKPPVLDPDEEDISAVHR